MGLNQPEGDSSGASGGISGKSSLMQEIQVSVPDNTITNNIKSSKTMLGYKNSSGTVSPQFGAHKNRKLSSNRLLSKQLDTSSISTTSIVTTTKI